MPSPEQDFRIDMTKIGRLESILRLNEDVQKILNLANSLRMPNWYLAAGGISQTVWNVLHGFDPRHAIKDYDLVYYDATDLSYQTEDDFIQKAKRRFHDIPVPVEVRNEARVHLWYPQKFGYEIRPHQTVEDAIRTFPATATCIGVKYQDGEFRVYAPFGLIDLFDMVVRPNNTQLTTIVRNPEKAREVYEAKVKRWIKIWPKLRVTPWEQDIS